MNPNANPPSPPPISNENPEIMNPHFSRDHHTDSYENVSFDEYTVGESCPPPSQYTCMVDDALFADLVVPETQMEDINEVNISKRKVSGFIFPRRVRKLISLVEEEEFSPLQASPCVGSEMGCSSCTGKETCVLDVDKVTDVFKNVGEDIDEDENPFIWSNLYEDSQPLDLIDSFVPETQFEEVENTKGDSEVPHPHQKIIDEMLRIYLPSYSRVSGTVQNKKRKG